ncbi:hypothetical protein NBO_7g0010 [Nosema bombycis CQ1]|uniref:Uncharacterized protein n=1 Tax=Nosema bombycis (strain CQ1 / CVCC 102059) TaxID=578461 RepID=R0KY91_NOSB1|nr:hypothetical protein NBO_7g0010 [Nosema bombycis CQ1]|eukprot:EOB15192.1 hypothetical protein NBO_7g0010 [Nosema bombycis CQ1]
MNLSELTTENDFELLNLSIKKCIRRIKDTVKNLKKNSEDCLLCQNKFKIHNIPDLIRIYSMIMHCLTYHCTSIVHFEIEDFFVVEVFLLKFIMKPEFKNIESIILFNNNHNEKLYKESLRNQLIALFQTHYHEKKIAFNCEQEIESLLYKYYKKLKLLGKTEYLDKPKYLLLILFLRNEYERFSKLFKDVEKDNFNLKLGILMNIIDENTSETEKLTEVYARSKTLNLKNEEMETFMRCINLKYKLELDDILDLFEDCCNIAVWVNNKKNKHHWEEFIRMWATNRRDSSNYVDNSMIDLCVVHLKFEDGWLIYNNSFAVNTSGFSRAIRLCTVAFRTTKSAKWKRRLLEVINDIFNNLDKVNLMILLENSYVELETLGFSTFLRVISELQRKLIKIKLEEEVIDTILSSYYSATVALDSLDVSKKLCAYSMDLYSKWTKSKQSFMFLTKKSSYDTRIYSNLLGICDNAKDCEQFYRLCKAILSDETRINREICRRLEKFHTNNCKECVYKNKQIITIKESKGFISHFFK